MSETKSEPTLKAKLKTFFKFFLWGSFILVIFAIILYALFITCFEIDGFAKYNYKKYNKNNSDNLLETVKDMYYKGRYVDAYNFSQGKILRYTKDIIINQYKEIDKLDNINIHNRIKDDEKAREYISKRKEEIKKLISKDNEYLKISYELELYNTTAEIMKDSQTTIVRHPSYYFKFLNRSSTRKLQTAPKITPTQTQEISQCRFFIKHSPIPEIYDYAYKLSDKANSDIIKLFNSALLFKTCNNYKDSKNLCVSNMEKILFDIFSPDKFKKEIDIMYKINNKKYYYNFYNSNGIINFNKLIDIVYFYNNFGGDMTKLKKRFDEFIKTLYEQSTKDYDEAILFKSKYNSQNTDFNFIKYKDEYNLIKVKLANSRTKFEYLSELTILKEAYSVTNFKIDSDLIEKSKEWIKQIKSIQTELNNEYIKIEKSYKN